MTNFFSQNDLYYLDYFLFIIGIIMITTALLAIKLGIKRRIFVHKKYLYVFVSFVLMNGLSIWVDFLVTVFSSDTVYLDIHYISYSISYLLLFEMGRSLFFKGQKSLLLYIVIPLLLLLGISQPVINSLLGFFGSFLVFFSLGHKEIMLDKKMMKYKFFIRFFFICLSVLYIIYVLIYLFGDTSLFSQFHIWKHAIEWVIVLIIAEFGLFNIIGFINSDPIEKQIGRLKMRLVKLATTVFIVFTFLGYFIVYNIGEVRFNYYQDELFESARLASLSVNGISNQLLLNDNDDIRDYTYKKIQNILNEYRMNSKYIDEFFTVLYYDGNLILGVNSNLQSVGNKALAEEINNNADKLKSVLASGEGYVENQLNVNQQNQWLTAYVPIKDSTGSISGLLGVNLSANKVMHHVKIFRYMSMLALLFLYTIFAIFAYIHYKNKRENAWRTYHTKILSSIGDIVGVFDKSYKLIYVNDAAYRLTGGDANVDVSTQSLWNYLPVEEYRRLKMLLDDLEENKISYDEFTLLGFNHQEIPVYASVSYLDNKQGEGLYVFTAMNISEQRKREEVIKDNFRNSLSLIATVIDAKDGYTALHSLNVAKYAKLIAKEFGFSNDKIREIETAAVVHDIGKVGIVDSILNKNGHLEAAEWEEMKRHPEYGKLILENAGDTFKHLIPYVYYHHERYDGKGYPTGMVMPSIPISIISVADAFDAMTSDRAYRKALNVENAKEQLIKFSGTQFHPEVVEAFLNAIKNIKHIEELK